MTGNSAHIRDLLPKDQAQHQKIQAMQEAISTSRESGIALDFSIESFIKWMVKSINNSELQITTRKKRIF